MTEGFTARTGAALLVLSAAVALDIGSVAIVNPALPDIGRGLGIGPGLLQWTLTAYGIGFAGLLLLGGRLADLASRRLVLGAGIAAFGVGALAAATATQPAVLIAGRALQGIGAALSVPAALALVFQVFPPGRTRNRALAVYTGVGAAGFGVGLVAGGLLTTGLGWRWVFVVSAVAALVVLVGVRAALPPSTGVREPLDVRGAVVGTSALAALVVAVSEARGDGEPFVAAVGAVVAIALGWYFLRHERRTRYPLFPARVLRPPGARAAAVGGAVFFLALNGVLFVVPLYVQGVLGYTPLHSGLAVLPMALVVSTTSQLSGRLMSRIAPTSLLVVGLLVLAVGVVLWTRTSSGSGFAGDVLPPVLVMALGQGLAYPALTAASLADVGPADHGVAGAVNVTAQQVGSGVGVAAVVALVSAAAGSSSRPSDLLAGYHLAYVVVAGVLVVGAGAVGVLGRSHAASAASSARRRCDSLPGAAE